MEWRQAVIVSSLNLPHPQKSEQAEQVPLRATTALSRFRSFGKDRNRPEAEVPQQIRIRDNYELERW
jgi:hypothetical protein